MDRTYQIKVKGTIKTAYSRKAILIATTLIAFSLWLTRMALLL